MIPLKIIESYTLFAIRTAKSFINDIPYRYKLLSIERNCSVHHSDLKSIFGLLKKALKTGLSLNHKFIR